MAAGTKKPEKTATVPYQSIDAAKAKPGPSARFAERQVRQRPQYSKGQTSASGILAEIDTALQNHHQQVQPKLSESFTEHVANILPSLGVKNAPPELIARIANEAANHSLEMLATVQDKEQIPQVLADSLTQSIAVDPEVASIAEIDEVQAYKNLIPQMETVAQNQAQELEKAAVLGNIAAVSSFSLPTSTIQTVADDQVEQLADIEAPLATPSDKNSAVTATQEYVKNYVDNFQQEIAPALSSGQTPTLEQLSTIKEGIYQKTTDSFKAQIDAAASGKSGLNLEKTIDNTSTLLSLKPLTVEKATIMGLGTAVPNTLTFAKSGGTMGFGIGLAMTTSPKVQQQTIYSLIAYNNPKLEGTISALATRQKELEDKLKVKRALSFHERLEYKNNKDRLRLFVNAQNFAKNQPKNFKSYLSYWGKGKIGQASGLAWGSISSLTALPGVPFNVIGGLGNEIRTFRPLLSPRQMAGGFRDDLKMNYQFARYMVTHPHTALKNEMLMYGKAFGALGFGMGNVRGLLNLKSTLKNAFSPQAFAGGMGMSMSTGFLKNAAKVSGVLFGGLAMYFMGLGKAAMTGFMVGAAVGGTAGAIYGGYLGFQLGLALAPFTFGLSIPIVTALGALTGFFLGGAIAGSAGALIAMGFYSGSTTAVTTGVGVAVGGLIGTIVGAALGAAAVAWIPIIGPALAPFGAIVGAYVGAIVGAAAGGLIGYAIGKVISTIGAAAGELAGGLIGGWNTIKGFFAGGISGASGLLVGLTSALWGGATSIAGGIWGGLVGAANFVAGGISAMASLPASVAGASVAIAGGTMATLGITATIAVAVSLSSIESEQANDIPGDNQYLTLTKVVDKPQIENPPPDQDLTFTIKLLAKDIKLTNIQITDKMEVRNINGSLPAITTDKEGASISPIPCGTGVLEPGQECTYSFTISVNSDFTDSTIINTASIRTTPEGQGETSEIAIATARVGNPPTQCTSGWPTTGNVTQGPEGSTSHGPLNLEALDISSPIGNDVVATVDGTVIPNDRTKSEALNQTIDVAVTSCPGLAVVRYQHLSAVNVSVGDTVSFGQTIGKVGTNCSADDTPSGCGPHLHYQFNVGNRDYKMEPPNIPQNVPRVCDGNCGVTISSAP